MLEGIAHSHRLVVLFIERKMAEYEGFQAEWEQLCSEFVEDLPT
jgi:hypothetical protein